jgi:integrase
VTTGDKVSLAQSSLSPTGGKERRVKATWTKTNTPGVRTRTGKDGGPQYLARWRDLAGRQRSATFGTKKEAIAAREGARAKVRRIAGGEERAPVGEGKTFDELAEHWLKIKAAKKKSIRDDRSMINRHLRPALGPILLTLLRKDVIDEVFVELVGEYDQDGEEIRPGKVGKKTAWNILTLLGSMLREAKKQDWIPDVPHVERPVQDQQDFVWITESQVEKLVVAASEDELHPQLAPIVATAAYSGMRAGEVLGLQWSDVDFQARRIAIRRSFGAEGKDNSTKSRRVRYVPLLGKLAGVLRDWKGACPSAVWVFPSRAGVARQAADRHLQEFFHGALDRAGISSETVRGSRGNTGHRVRKRRAFTFHDLRHSFASNWMVAGEDLFKLSKVLGHKSITTTERYAHLAPEAFDGIQAMGGAREGAAPQASEFKEEVVRLRAEVERLQAETARQQKILDRLLAG